MATSNKSDEPIKLERIGREIVSVKIKGTAPLITHRWDEKAKQQLLDGQQGRRTTKAPKDPEACYEASRYRLPDGGDGFPVTGFKAATVGAARYFQSVAMTELKRALFFHGEGPEQLVRIMGTPEMREDMVRVGKGTADIRYRAMFPEWTATLQVTYVSGLLDFGSLISLIDAGGMGGIGEWRPEKAATGSFGTYEVIEQ